jgi:hypothetical protein
MDQLAREALGLTRREGDAVEVFRDPFGALSRSLSTSTVSGLLTAITVAQAGSLLGDATGWAAVLAGGAVFYFALSAERSRVR